MMDQMKGFSVKQLRVETITSKEDTISDDDMPFTKRPARRKQTRVELDMGSAGSQRPAHTGYQYPENLPAY